MAFAARRSNIDLVFKSLAGSADFTTVAAPVYYDYQYIASIRPTDRDRVHVMMYGSSDRVELIFGNGERRALHCIQTSWHRDISESVSQDIQITAGTSRFDAILGQGGKQLINVIDIGGRAEWAFPLSSRVRAVVGLDLQNNFYRGTYTGVQPSEDDATGNSAAVGDFPVSFAFSSVWAAEVTPPLYDIKSTA